MEYVLCLSKIGTIEDAASENMSDLFLKVCAERGVGSSSKVVWDEDIKPYGINHVPCLLRVDDEGHRSCEAYGVFRKDDLEVWLTTGYLPTGVYEMPHSSMPVRKSGPH